MNGYESYVLGAGLVLLSLQAWLTFFLLKGLRCLKPVEERVAHFGDALALLTETSESGFRAIAAEVERLGAASARAAEGRTTNARVASAAKRGMSVHDIAADEQVSESEVRLRLHLSEQARAAAMPHDAAPRPRKPRTERKLEFVPPAIEVSDAPAKSRRAAPAADDKALAAVAKAAPARVTRSTPPARGKTNGSVRA